MQAAAVVSTEVPPEGGGGFFSFCSSIITASPSKDGKDGTCNQIIKSMHAVHKDPKLILNARIFGGNPVDLVTENLKKKEQELLEGAVSGSRKRRTQGGQNSGRGKGQMLTLNLPALEECYSLISQKKNKAHEPRAAGVGILKEAQHHESKQKRAVLSIPKKTVPSHVMEEDIMKLLQNLALIDHINILAFHDACEDENYFHLVYDWPEGGLLLHHLTAFHDELTEWHLAGIVKETLSALMAANHFGVHHLDWNLLCLFLGYKGRMSPLKLFGVGLAGTLLPLVSSRNYSRTNKHFYMAPEIITENLKTMPSSKRHACDIWSLGTILYMLCSGRPPFFGTHTEVTDRIKKGKWIFGHEFDVISREGKHIVEEMLQKKWNSRPTAQALLTRLWLTQTQMKRGEGIIPRDALEKLDHFAKETHVKQALARLLADLGLQEQQYTELEEQFKKIDIDGNGVIEVSELRQHVRSLNPDTDLETCDEAIRDILSACDRNNNSTIDISEFVAAVVFQLEMKDERLMLKAFDKMDMNGDARVTKAELFKVLRCVSASLTPREVAEFLTEHDKDNDQKMDYDDFKDLFPKMNERNDEAKIREGVNHEISRTKKLFEKLKGDTEQFFKELKICTGKIAFETKKLLKNGGDGKEEELRKLLVRLHEIIKDFAGKATNADAARLAENERKEKLVNLTGLTVISLNKKHDAEDQVLQKQQSFGGSDSETSESAKLRGSSANLLGPEGGGAAPGTTAGGAPVPLVAQKEESLGERKFAAESVAEIYVMRGHHTRHMTLPQIKKEAVRRRKFLWLAASEKNRSLHEQMTGSAIDKIKNNLLALEGAMIQKRGQTIGDDKGDVDVQSPEESDHQEEEKESNSEEEKDEDAGEEDLAAKEKEAEKLMLNDDTGFEHWTTNKQKYNRSKDAMESAGPTPPSGGPLFTKVGSLSPRSTRVSMKQIEDDLCIEYRLTACGPEEFSDLSVLLRYKCVKCWLPTVMLWERELLDAAKDEQRTKPQERRKYHTDCGRACCQLVERIMFSLSEFLCWQEEAIVAMCSVEDQSEKPPNTVRFLPFRVGEEDENAMTPRDEEHANELAPDEEMFADFAASHMNSTMAASMGAGGFDGKAVSFADSEMMKSAGKLSASKEGSQAFKASGAGIAASNVIGNARPSSSSFRISRASVRCSNSTMIKAAKPKAGSMPSKPAADRASISALHLTGSQNAASTIGTTLGKSVTGA